jgi:uncharacterized protein
MRKWWVYGLLLVSIVAAASGLLRLRFDTDILSMLPGELPEVKGLKAYQQAFSRQDEAVLLVQRQDSTARPVDEAAKSLCLALEKAGAVKKARWQPRWTEDPKGLSELLAYLWLNGDPAQTAALADSLKPGKSQETLQGALESLATSMSGQEIAMQAHDPFGFLNHPAIAQLMSSGSGEKGGATFTSPDGSAHLVFIDSPKEIHGYRNANDWISSVKNVIQTWEKGEGRGFHCGLTGEPVFSSEIGSAMEYDLSGTIGITLALIAILFWWMQRRFMLLVGLMTLQVLIFAVAMGIAGWVYGQISIMALSAAEILIGLSTDYGLVICQEAKVAGHDRKALLHASGRPVICGALITSVVFLALNLGGFPGISQLGSIVAYGLAAAGIMMIVIYLPWVSKYGVDRAPAVGNADWLPRSRRSWLVTGAIVVISAIILAVHGMPGVNFDSKLMRPKNSQAMTTLEQMQEKFPTGEKSALRMIVEAGTDEEMTSRLVDAHARLDAAKAQGVIKEYSLPQGWWPQDERQKKNAPILAALVKDSERLFKEADEAGFTTEGIGLGRMVFEALAKPEIARGHMYPSSPAAREVMELFLRHQDHGGGYVMGRVTPNPGFGPNDADYAKLREVNGNGLWLSDWSLFQPAISGLVEKDITRMLLPMGVILLVMMAVIFRRIREVWFAVFAMIVTVIGMLAVMSLCGLQWNFVNLMATPLLLGTGIDYAIHVTLTLRRTGCFKEFWNGTGKALLFCGASNIIGFGSLVWSSSESMISLGQVAVIGIIFSMAVSLCLLPGWLKKS